MKGQGWFLFYNLNDSTVGGEFQDMKQGHGMFEYPKLVTIRFQAFWLGTDKKASPRQRDDIAEVVAELECTLKIGIPPGPTKKCRYSRIADIDKFYCTSFKNRDVTGTDTKASL